MNSVAGLPPRIPIYLLILFFEFFQWLDQIFKAIFT